MKTTKGLILALLVAAFSVPAFAQVQSQPPAINSDDITDEELKMVVNIADSATHIQEEANLKMKKIVESEGMKFERFQEIVMAQQNPQLAARVEITDDEQTLLEKVQGNLMLVNDEAQQKYIATIENEGLTVEKFQQIAMAIQSDTEVARRFEEIRAAGTGG